MNCVDDGCLNPVLQTDECADRKKTLGSRRTFDVRRNAAGCSPADKEMELYADPDAKKGKSALHHGALKLRIILETQLQSAVPVRFSQVLPFAAEFRRYFLHDGRSNLRLFSLILAKKNEKVKHLDVCRSNGPPLTRAVLLARSTHSLNTAKWTTGHSTSRKPDRQS